MIVERIYVPNALVSAPKTWPWSIPAVNDLVGDGAPLNSAVTLNRPGFHAVFFLVKGFAYAQETPVRGS